MIWQLKPIFAREARFARQLSREDSIDRGYLYLE
jgi:hypothetical protein